MKIPESIEELEKMYEWINQQMHEARRNQAWAIYEWACWTAVELAETTEVRAFYPHNPAHRGKLACRIIDGLFDYDAERGIDPLDTVLHLPAEMTPVEWCLQHPAYADALRHGVSQVNAELIRANDEQIAARQRVEEKMRRARQGAA